MTEVAEGDEGGKAMMMGGEGAAAVAGRREEGI